MTKRKEPEPIIPFSTIEEYEKFVRDKNTLDELSMTIGRWMYEGKESQRRYSSWPPSFDGIARYAPEGVYLYEEGTSYGDGYTEHFEYLLPVDCLLHSEKYEEEWAQEAKIKQEARDAEQKENQYQQYLRLKEKFGE